MICPSCGKKNSGDSQFCTNCGTDLKSEKGNKQIKGEIFLRQGPCFSPALMEGEKVLGEFSSGFRLLGVWKIPFIGGWKQIVVTSHRILYASKNWFKKSFRCLPLRAVESTHVETELKLAVLIIGIILLLGGIFYPADAAFYGYDSMYDSYDTGYSFGIPWYFRLIVILVSLYLLSVAKKKMITVTVGDKNNSASLYSAGLKKKDIKRFVDLVSEAAENIQSGKLKA